MFEEYPNTMSEVMNNDKSTVVNFKLQEILQEIRSW